MRGRLVFDRSTTFEPWRATGRRASGTSSFSAPTDIGTRRNVRFDVAAHRARWDLSLIYRALGDGQATSRW